MPPFKQPIEGGKLPNMCIKLEKYCSKVDFVGKSGRMPIRPGIQIKSNIIRDFRKIYDCLLGEIESGKYEIYVDYSNISPLADVQAAVSGACRRASDLRGAALCGPDRAH
jgi:hypothetical protein